METSGAQERQEGATLAGLANAASASASAERPTSSKRKVGAGGGPAACPSACDSL